MDRESSYLSSFDKKKLNKGEARAAARKRNWGSRIAKYKIIEIIIKSQENFIQERKWKKFFWEGERERAREWSGRLVVFITSGQDFLDFAFFIRNW